MSESRGKQRRFTAEEKRAILTEAEQPGVTITAVCRKHGIAATQFYRWRAVAEQGVEAALKADGRGRAKGNGDSETARLQAEIERLRAVVTEITAENLGQKKDLRLDSEARVSAAVQAEVIAWVEKTERRSGWPLQRIVRALGVSRSRYYEWLARCAADRLADTPAPRVPLTRLLGEEKAAICAFAQRHPKIGYRKLAWMMIDQGIVCVDESSVYRVLKEADLLYRHKRSEPSEGEYRFRPTAPNQQWHTDVMYVWVAGCWYFLVSFIDAYSRYVVHHKLMIELNGRSMATELQAALDGNPGAQPRVVHDHGSEYVNRDLAAVIKVHNLLDIKTRRRHPESNGIAERFNGTVRESTGDDYGESYLQAEAIIARLVDEYNEQRLHAALGYMEPALWHRGDPQARRVERAQKLSSAKALRRAINKQRQQEALAA